MKALIRVNGSAQIGLGHIYRGIAFAEMLKEEFEIEFIINQVTVTSPIEKAGFNYTIIQKGIELSDEPFWLKKNFTNESIIILDGYDFNENYQENIKTNGFKLIYIDDLVKGIQKADLVINHSLGIIENDYSAEPYTKLALGADYAILRPGFLKLAEQTREIEKIDSAFVCFGGSDVYDLSSKVTKALLKIKQFKKINIILGASYQYEEIFRLVDENSRVIIYQNLSENDLIKVMQDSNFAIVPASTILYELCYVKMPILSGYYVENQKNIFESLLKNNVIFPCDDMKEMSENDFKNKISECLQLDFHAQLNQQMKLFSGGNKKRLINLIKLLTIKFRNVEEKDLNLLFEWVNDVDVRNNAINSKIIKFKDHKVWFGKIINSESSKIYIFENEIGTAIGQVRFDFKNEEFVIDYSIDSNFRGKGYGKFIIEYSIQKLIEELNKPNVKIIASVKNQNIASLKIFKSLKFNVLNGKDDLVNFNKIYT